jgi:hypothetical protein
MGTGKPTLDDILEEKAATDPQFAIAFALLRLADAADSIATSLETMAKTIRVRQT